ncbi:MAG: FTR1 family iron permease [Spirochaetaceae bacterium]|jgi:high-affinity iron transporter|nr:FTR1 family iron permease [Spirochaetaceae bacterium]
MKKKLTQSIIILTLILSGALSLSAEDAPPSGAAVSAWQQEEEAMRRLLNEAYYRFVSGDKQSAQGLVDKAYAERYQGDFRRNVAARISEARAANIDEWFLYVKDALGGDKTQKEAQQDVGQLTYLLRVTANRLDGKEEPVAQKRNWTKTADEMAAVLERAYQVYRAGDAKGAKDQVDVAYFQYYEKVGFEKIVMARLSGERASVVEYQFAAAKKAITRGDAEEAVKASLDLLASYLKEDAEALDGEPESAWGVFLASLLIILREGFEAILIVGAIVAYLIKSGNKKKTTPVYWGSLIALVLSVVMAALLSALTSTASGQNQEIIEGATMLLAVVVLFYVSNWMVSKSEAEAWSTYIEGKVQGSIERGSMFSLAFAAFLAVFREGAEVILFYQALLAGNQEHLNMIWLGLAVGAVALVVVYVLIRVLSLRLPLKPFFLGTSVLLFLMSIAFTGSGVKELQEGNVIGVTMLPWNFTVDLLGVYPTLETLLPQALLLAATAWTFVHQIRKNRRLTRNRALTSSPTQDPRS